MLDVTYRLPSGFDLAKKYPVWIQTYSGPASPSVRDAWPRARRRVPGATANDWYVVLQVNVRSASTQGMKYSKYCYRSFGVQAVRDLEDAIDWLCTHPWADRARVGISGWSFGGFMTAFAMTHSDRFKCGIAGAGVYDWRLYDTIYTERYMATPQHNREGYDGSSVVKAAKNLRGHLLLVHGTMDDNVHFQNTVQLVHALQQAGKQNFELMIYPRSRHGVGSRHLGALQQKFIRERL
ncbi:MAG: S9 family peptidase [Planctomycetes bacterium]|nr:S9 family peptidase [Planctomycetota bacterium]